MAEYLDREHFIPLRKHDLMDLLLRDKQLPAEQREPFRQFCRLVSATFHFEYQAKLEDLKDAYAPFDPDADTKPCKPLHAEERKEREDKVFAAFAAPDGAGQLQATQARGNRAGPASRSRATGACTWTWTSTPSSSGWRSTSAATWSASSRGGRGGRCGGGRNTRCRPTSGWP